jgi:hypothetical protein
VKVLLSDLPNTLRVIATRSATWILPLIRWLPKATKTAGSWGETRAAGPLNRK